ncbi:hypothetical protein GCM10023238_35450 [Streptomyces heliomycini]
MPRLADDQPSFERVLAAEPDFVAASFASTLSAGGVAPREKFEELGVPTYLSPARLRGQGQQRRRRRLTDEATGHGHRLPRSGGTGTGLGVEDRGEELVARLKSRVAKAASGVRAEDTTVLYWFANQESPYMAGCCGAPRRHHERARGEERPRRQQAGMAPGQLGDRRRPRPRRARRRRPHPQVATAESAAKKIAFLESHPATRNMRAVKGKSYVLLSGQAMNPTIRTVEGVEKVAAALRAHGLAG